MLGGGLVLAAARDAGVQAHVLLLFLLVAGRVDGRLNGALDLGHECGRGSH